MKTLTDSTLWFVLKKLSLSLIKIFPTMIILLPTSKLSDILYITYIQWNRLEMYPACCPHPADGMNRQTDRSECHLIAPNFGCLERLEIWRPCVVDGADRQMHKQHSSQTVKLHFCSGKITGWAKNKRKWKQIAIVMVFNSSINIHAHRCCFLKPTLTDVSGR